MVPAKEPITRLAGPYGHPLHPALVSVPIGAWTASFVFDLASRAVSSPQVLAEGSRWLIGLGILGALAAALVGFLDLLAIPTGTRAFRIALLHMSLNLSATALYAVGFFVRDAHPTGAVPIGQIVLSAVALAAVGIGGFLGGELVFRHGVRVAEESTQAEAFHHK
jgi:uncharacterized membrane protein